MATLPCTEEFQALALLMAPWSKGVSTFADLTEHNRPIAREWVIEAAYQFRMLASGYADAWGRDILDLYAARLGVIEKANVLQFPGSYDGCAGVHSAKTWRDLQIVQIEHDTHYHPDVAGLSRYDQLRHFAFHLDKLVGFFAEPEKPEENLVIRRLPDTLLFGIKLSTVMGVFLPESPLSEGVA